MFPPHPRAASLVQVHAGCHRPDRRYVDVIIGVHAPLVFGRKRVAAFAAFTGVDITGVIGGPGQPAGCALAALAALFCLALGTVGLLALGRRQRGIVRGLGRLAQLRLQFRHAGLQGGNLFRHGQNEADQFLFVKRIKCFGSHPGFESAGSHRVNAQLAHTREPWAEMGVSSYLFLLPKHRAVFRVSSFSS